MIRHSIAVAFLALFACVTPALAQQSSSSRGNSNMSNQQNSPVATNQKAVSQAQAEVTKAQADINRITSRVHAQVLAKPEWASVVAAQRQAQLAVDSAKRTVLNVVHNKQDYKDLTKEREQAQTAMSQANADSKGNDADAQKAADSFMKASFAMKQLENTALKDDTKYDEAKKQLEAADAKLRELDPQVKQALNDDPEYQTASKTLEAAKTKLDAAKKQLAQAVQSEHSNRNQQSKSRQQGQQTGH